jgi:ribonuclease HI
VAKTKYYVVWKGRKRGIFPTWAECERQVKGFVGAEFKAFESAAEARAAFSAGYAKHRGKPASQGKWKRGPSKPRLPSLCADAACSGSPGWLEYRVVETETGQQLLREGPMAEGTNNVGEFLAIVEALRWLKRHRLDWPIYSDSENAIGWVRARRCNTKLKRTSANRRLFEMISHAVADLPGLLDEGVGSPGRPLILKWETKSWGENPADFGRK